MKYQVLKTEDEKELMNEYHIHPLLAKVICSFGYSKEEIASFFHPVFTFTFDEKVFLPLKNELQRIKQQNQKVYIFGDYDCDGICSTVIARKILDQLGIASEFYVPDRQKEGYGLNLARLQQAYDLGCRVLITVDNGISAVEPIKWAKQMGMTVIVTDHHVMTTKVDYDYLLHPSLLPKDYQYLCGAGVVYLLAQYLQIADDTIKILAMIATISDVMSLKGINVGIVQEGLNLLRNRDYPQIQLLLENFSKTINEEDIAFHLAPKINAIGRMSPTYNPNHMVSYLLLDQNKQYQRVVAGSNWVRKVNLERQQISASQTVMVEQLLDESAVFYLIYHSQLHEGLLGLIASRIASKTGKITLIFTDSEEGCIKGSARSIKGVDLMDLFDEFKDHFLHFGGHSLACGISMKKDQLSDLKNYLERKTAQLVVDETEPVIEVDFQQLNNEALDQLFQYRPFGQDRKIPLIKTTIEQYTHYQSLKTNNQLKWTTPNLSFLSFSNNQGYDFYLTKQRIEVIGELRENYFNGRKSYQLMIKEFI